MSSSSLEAPCGVESSVFSTPTSKVTDHPTRQVDVAIVIDDIGEAYLRTDKPTSPTETPPPEYAECVPLLSEGSPKYGDDDLPTGEGTFAPKDVADGEGSPAKKATSERLISEGPPSYMESVKFSSKKQAHEGPSDVPSDASSDVPSQEPADDGKSCATLIGCLVCGAAVPFGALFVMVKLIEAFANDAL